MPKSKHISDIHKCRDSALNESVVRGSAIKQAGFWELDIGTGTMCWSLVVRTLFEVPEHYEPSLNKLFGFCINESEKDVLKKAFDDCIGHATPFEAAIDIRSAKGQQYTLSVMGKAIASDGKTTRIYGSIRNALKQASNNSAINLPNDLTQQSTEILEALPDMLIEVDALGNVLAYHAPENMHLFHHHEKIIGKNIAGLLEHGNGIVTAVKNCIRERKSCRHEFVVTIKEQTSVCEARILPVGTDRCLLLIRDLANAAREEAEIRQNEQKYTRLIENMQIGLMEADEKETIIRVHPAFCKMTGYAEQELIGEKTNSLFFAPQIKIKTDAPEIFESKLRKKSGELLNVIVSSAPIYNTKAKIIGSANIVHDVTLQKRTSRMLEESNRIGKIGMFELDLLENKVLWNDEMHELFETEQQYKPDIKNFFSHFANQDDLQRAHQIFQILFEKESSYDDVLEFVTGKNNHKWIRIVASSEFHEEKPVRMYGIAIDVTKMKQYESELEAHADLSDTILSSIQDGFYVVDEAYNVSFVNESGASYIGKDATSLLGKNIWQVFPEAIDLFYDAFERVKKTKEPEQMTHYLFVGDIGRWFNIKIYPTRKGGISVFYRDVSKEKQAEESIRNLNDRYSAISAATNQILYEWDLITDNVEFNEVFFNVTGYKHGSEATKGSLHVHLVHPDDRQRIDETLRACFENKKANWSGVYRFKIADGSYRNMHSRGIIRFGTKNEALRMLGTIEDITEREQLNEKLMREQVSAQRKINEAVLDAQEKERAFIGRELHDNVNQILTTASLYLELAESESFQSPNTVHEIRALIRRGIEEIRLLSRQLTPPILRDIGLTVAIKDLVGLVAKASSIHFSVNTGADIVHELSNEKSLVLYRICQELLNNVIKYSGAINCFIILEKTRKKQVRLIIKDDGKGFDAITTKKGIGLNSTVARVEIYGGSFQINSSPGKGCTVVVEIPL